jgi:hypothetical protein
MADAAVPGFTASPEFQAKLDSLDDQLNPVTEELVDEKPKDEAEETAEEQEETPVESQEADETEESAEESEEGEGYTIDGDEDEEEAEEEVPVAVTPDQVQTVNRADLTPEQNYLLDNLRPITVRGYVGDGELQEFQVLAPEQLPVGFKYVDERESSIAIKSFNMLEQRATELQNEFRNQQTAKVANEFKKREDDADRYDIGQLQRSGDLPKFRTSPNDKNFEQDPGVVMVQEILDFKETLNERYMQEYNAGRPYKHIGFEEAFAMWKRQNPSVDPKVGREDAERESVARRTSKTQSKSAEGTSRKRGAMNSRELEMYLEGLDF